MKDWKRVLCSTAGLPLYVRRPDYRHREFAVRHPLKGLVPFITVPREACYSPERMRHIAQKGRNVLERLTN